MLGRLVKAVAQAVGRAPDAAPPPADVDPPRLSGPLPDPAGRPIPDGTSASRALPDMYARGPGWNWNSPTRYGPEPDPRVLDTLAARWGYNAARAVRRRRWSR